MKPIATEPSYNLYQEATDGTLYGFYRGERYYITPEEFADNLPFLVETTPDQRDRYSRAWYTSNPDAR